MIIVKQLTALLVIVTLSFQVHTEELNFEVIDNPQQHMQTEREAALKEDKKLLWVLGSEWCHDSRSLLEKMSSPELAKILADNYRVSLIDVSYLNQGFLPFDMILG